MGISKRSRSLSGHSSMEATGEHLPGYDIGCAFKLLHTEFLHAHPLESRGAMISAELLLKLKQAGCTYKEVGIHHLPRRGGWPTGSKLSVIIRAFRELFIFARKW